jgi:nicotinamide riboside kinase
VAGVAAAGHGAALNHPPVGHRAFVIALLGAESTGKTTLARDLATWVGETLREWCDRAGRTPQPHEQRAIAEEQARRIDAAAASHDLVVADTTALMTAVYSEQVFGDPSLLAEAAARQRGYSLTLLMALDLPWVADGLQRDGPQVRAPVDANLRRALMQAGTDFSVVNGSGVARLQCALAAVAAARRPPPSTGAPRWRHLCARCGDPECERHALPL